MTRPNGIQATYWILTIPYDDWAVPSDLPDGVSFITGQAETGESGYRHWQVMVIFARNVRLRYVKNIFGSRCHCEPTRSAAAESYCQKEDTRIPGTQFTLGVKPFKRNSRIDWDNVYESIKSGDFDSVPRSIFVRHYSNVLRIHRDNLQPVAMQRVTKVFWGDTGTGKTRTAFEQAGVDCYFKDPNTKWWDGYKGQENVIIDEFRGRIDVSHLLRWLDRYPVRVELKGSCMPLMAIRFWITSNVDPNAWYPELDEASRLALRRRFESVVHFNGLNELFL